MAMASKTHPLLITEIVAIIFNHLQNVDGTSSLVACAQVNSLWTEEAIRHTWHQDDCRGRQVNSLRTMPNCRRQIYANHMRSINGHNILLAPLQFPRLESASFLIPTNRDERFRLQYLVPSLRTLHLYEDGWKQDMHEVDAHFEYVSDDFLLQIQERCPNLVELGIETPQNDAHADSIHRLLRNMPSIRRLSICCNKKATRVANIGCDYLGLYCNTIASNQHYHRCDLEEGPAKEAYTYLFALLAKHGMLMELKWGTLMFPAIVEKAMETSPRPFHQLRNLHCHATNTTLLGLLPCLPNLEVLVLLLDTAPSRPRAMVRLKILPSLARCTNLRVFKLSATPDHSVHIPLQAILDFACASNQLEQLELNGGNFENIRVPGITDSHFDTLVSQLPGLRKLGLRLSFGASLSTRSLFSLGARCRALEKLDLGGNFDLSLHGSIGRVLFPNLRKVTLGRVNCESNSSSAHNCAMTMLNYAPKSTLTVRHDDVFGASVHEAHRRLLESREFNDRLEQYSTV